MSKISPAWFFIVPLVIWILYLTQCRGKVDSTSTEVTKIDTQRIISEYVGNTVPHLDTVYLPGDTIWKKIKQTIPGKPPTPIFVEVVKEIPTKVDTQNILKDYYKVRLYTDSFTIVSPKDDTSQLFRVFVSDTVTKNQLRGKSWSARVTTQVITKTTTKVKKPWSIYGELGPYQSKTQFISAGELTLGYLNRKGQGFEFSLLRTKDEWYKGIKFHQTIFQSKQ